MMGLDITAYSALKRIPEQLDEAAAEGDGVLRITQNILTWSNQFGEPPRAGDLAAGDYSFDKRFDFRPGSYSSYNRWRDMLSIAAGYGPARVVFEVPPDSGPFLELINFADNEGLIGPTVSAKLAKDFADNRTRILDAIGDPQGKTDWARLYYTWHRAFEMASHGGAVKFH